MTVAMTMAPPPSAVAGQDLGNPTLATFTFTDGSIDDYTAVIDWGDGTVSDGTITPDVDGGWDVSGDYTYSTPAPMNVEVTVQGDGYGASGMVPLNVAPGSGSGSGSGSGGSSSGGGSNSGGGSGSTGGTMPDGLGQDLALIGQNSNLTVNPELLPFSYLMIRGGTPWDDLKPGQPSTQSSSNSNTQTVNGTTYTTTSSRSSTYTTDGNPGSSGGGSWSISYQEQDSFSQTITGTDSNGRATTSIANNTADLTWDAWGDNGGVTHYEVVSDDTEDDSYSANAGAYAQEADQDNDAHLKAEGVVGTDGTLQSGDFTYAGDISNTFSLTDGFHPPSGQGAGDSVSYNDSTAENLSEGGNLIPGSSSQGGMTINSAETGDISITDGQGGFDGVSRNDADSVQESYDGSQTSGNPTPGSGNTVSASGPQSNLQIPAGKNSVTVIDSSDQGWFSWPTQARKKYAKDNGFDPNQNPTGGVANGTDIKRNLFAPSNATLVDGSAGVQQVVLDLDEIALQSGLIDVLVIGDHGAPGIQQLGNDALTPRLDPNNPTLLDAIAGRVKSGGTLVFAGCSVFAPSNWNDPQASLDAWQAYSTAHNITIIGSVAVVNYGDGTVTGVWVTVTPGGTPPKITK